MTVMRPGDRFIDVEVTYTVTTTHNVQVREGQSLEEVVKKRVPHIFGIYATDRPDNDESAPVVEVTNIRELTP